MRVLALIAAAFLLPPFCSAVAGQSIYVQVTNAESGVPLGGAFVSLIDHNGHVVRSALTNDIGEALLAATAAGTVRVRAEMIGRATQVSSPLDVRAGQTERIRIALPLHAITLAEIRVDADERCRLRPDEATEIARVWESARTSLSVQAWTEQQRVYRLDVTTWERDLDRSGRRVERESRRSRSGVTRAPFASLPIEDLLGRGFVRALDNGGYEYLGPDADLLLSDQFLDTHCFRLTRSGAQPGAIGLAFAPVSADARSDIEGTLWLDQQSGNLRLLEYHYTSVPFEEARGLAAGRLEFEAMPNGAWIIRRWWIRAPLLGRYPNLARAGDSGIRVTGMRETGGEVVGVSTLAWQPITQSAFGVLTGVVWDSTRAAPLAGAAVYLSGTPYAGSSDAGGRFVLENLPAGVFTAGFTHPRLDSLGIAAPGVEVEVVTADTADLMLAVPSSATILLAACREQVEPGEAPGAVVSGTVTDRARRAAIPGATVRLEWQQIARDRAVVQARDRWLEVRTDADGRYTACAIPIAATVRVRASLLDYRSAVATVGLAEAEHRTVDLTIALPAGLSSAGDQPGSAGGTESGTQGIQGILTDRSSGAPLRSAEITVSSLSGEAVATGLTDERGFFRLQTPLPGRYLIAAQALGYRAISGEAVDIARGRLAMLEIGVVPEAMALEPLVATAASRAFHLEVEGFYRRRQDGLGVFMTPEIFERRNPRRASDLLFGVAGTYVAEPTTGAGGRAVYFRSGIRFDPRGTCWPMVFINRQLVSTGGFVTAGAEPLAIDELVHAADLQAMEVYRSPAEIPPEFNGPNAGCGVIVLWTRRGGGD